MGKKIKVFLKDTLFVVSDIITLTFALLCYLFKGHLMGHSIVRENRLNNLYILGNGPSLQKAISVNIDNNMVDFCAVNFSMLTDVYAQLKPKIHVFADPVFLNNIDFPNVREVHNYIREKIDWDIMICIPYGVPGTFREICKSNSHINLVEIKGVAWKNSSQIMSTLKYELYKKNIIRPRFQNVIVAAIYAAINMGYHNIQLFGVEHSWLKEMYVNEKNFVCLRDEHYYGKEDKVWKDGNGNPMKIKEILIHLSRMFDGYDELLQYTNYLGDVKVKNCTPNSYIDAFERG